MATLVVDGRAPTPPPTDSADDRARGATRAPGITLPGDSSQSQRWWVPSRRSLGLLVLIMAAAFAMRFLTLRELPYPPSSDAAGDLTWLHTFLGQPLPGYGIPQAPPPVYIVGIVLPFTAVFGTFLGIQVLMAVMPAVLALPMYALLRWAGFGELPALAAAALAAFSAVTSEMIAWNSAFNLTGIVFLLAFFALWVRLPAQGSWKRLVPGAFALSLVAGAHPVSCLYGVATVAAYYLVVAVVRSPSLLAHARATAAMLGLAVLFSLPWVPFYYYAYTGLSNLGPASSQSPLDLVLTSYSLILAAPWGGATPVPRLSVVGAFLLVEMAASLVALVLIWRDPRDRRLATIGLAQVLAALALIPLDPPNSERILDFLPMVWIPLTVAWVSRAASSRPVRTVGARLAVGPLRRSPERLRRGLTTVAAVALAAAFVGVNAYVAQDQLSTNERFYAVLDGNTVAGLDWLRENTPSNASVFDGANLRAWITGYAQRQGYSPGPLSADITALSYQTTYNANLIQLGSLVLADPYLAVATNAPGPASSPALYLRTAANWLPLWSTSTGVTILSVTTTHGPRSVSLENATSVTTTGEVEPNGTALLTTVFGFTGLGFSVNESAWLAGPDAGVGFSVSGATLGSVYVNWSLPPSTYYYTYGSVPKLPLTAGVSMTLSLSSSSHLSLVVTGSIRNGTIETDVTGWTRLHLTFASSLAFSVQGYAGAGGSLTPVYINTLSLATTLGIRYFIASSTADYAVYARLNLLARGVGPGLVVVFTSGEVKIFESE